MDLPQPPARLYLARVKFENVDGPVEHSLLIAAHDDADANHKLFDYPAARTGTGAQVESVKELADDVARVWMQDGEPWTGTPTAE